MITPLALADLRAMADKAGLDRDFDTYRLLHDLLDAYEGIDDRIAELEDENMRLQDEIENYDCPDCADLEERVADLEDELSELRSARE